MEESVAAEKTTKKKVEKRKTQSSQKNILEQFGCKACEQFPRRQAKDLKIIIEMVR